MLLEEHSERFQLKKIQLRLEKRPTPLAFLVRAKLTAPLKRH